MPASCEGAKARQQDMEREWLGQVIVRAGVETTDDVFGCISGGQQEDRCTDTALPKALNDGNSIQAGQHHIENEHIEAARDRGV